jgi:hypothetical protein
MRRTAVVIAGSIAACALALCGAGCGRGYGDDGAAGAQGARPAGGTFVGKVRGTDAYIALVSDGERVVGYISDGGREKGGGSISIWLGRSKLYAGRAELTVRKDGSQAGEARLSRGVTGDVLVNGAPHRFSAQRAEGRAGLYRGTRGRSGASGALEAGAIVLEDGSFRGFVSTIAGSRAVQPLGEFDPRRPRIQTRSGSVTLSRVTTRFAAESAPEIKVRGSEKPRTL